jgi:hypothetical protein
MVAGVRAARWGPPGLRLPWCLPDTVCLTANSRARGAGHVEPSVGTDGRPAQLARVSAQTLDRHPDVSSGSDISTIGAFRPLVVLGVVRAVRRVLGWDRVLADRRATSISTRVGDPRPRSQLPPRGAGMIYTRPLMAPLSVKRRRGGRFASWWWRVREVTDPKCRCRGVSRPRWIEVSPLPKYWICPTCVISDGIVVTSSWPAESLPCDGRVSRGGRQRHLGAASRIRVLSIALAPRLLRSG